MPVLVPEPVTPAGVPSVSGIGERAWGFLPGYVRSADDGTVRALLQAWGAPVESLVALLTDPGLWTDPQRAPFERLPWLAAFTGVDLTGVPESRWREWIADPRNQFRGNRDTIVRRVGLTLTGARQVEVACPYLGSPWRIYVATLADETPDEAATLAAIDAEVPAWLQVTYERRTGGLTYDGLAARYATYGDMTSTGKTYTTLSTET